MDAEQKRKIKQLLNELMYGYNEEMRFVAKFVEELKDKFRENGALDCFTEQIIEDYRRDAFNRLKHSPSWNIEDVSNKK